MRVTERENWSRKSRRQGEEVAKRDRMIEKQRQRSKENKREINSQRQI